MADMTSRTSVNCQQEPPYPDHFTVVFSIRYPDWCAHAATSRCAKEHPHLISDCGEFDA